MSLLLDPRPTIVTVFRSGAEPRVERRGESIDLDDIIPGFVLAIDELYAALRAR